MKIFLTMICLIFAISGFSQSADSIANPNYDANLAEELEADAYGMKSYVLVMLKSGSNNSKDQKLIRESFRGHMKNINRLVEEGKMIVAGPMGKNGNDYRGIFILDVQSKEEAKKLLKDDSAIANGFLEAELYTWYGSAALPEYLEAADKIWKKQP